MFISELLERCTKMRTTNPNESINSHIWRRAPKHLPLCKPTVDIVVEMAIQWFYICVGELEHSFWTSFYDIYLIYPSASGVRIQLAMPPHQQ